MCVCLCNFAVYIYNIVRAPFIIFIWLASLVLRLFVCSCVRLLSHLVYLFACSLLFSISQLFVRTPLSTLIPS